MIRRFLLLCLAGLLSGLLLPGTPTHAASVTGASLSLTSNLTCGGPQFGANLNITGTFSANDELTGRDYVAVKIAATGGQNLLPNTTNTALPPSQGGVKDALLFAPTTGATTTGGAIAFYVPPSGGIVVTVLEASSSGAIGGVLFTTTVNAPCGNEPMWGINRVTGIGAPLQVFCLNDNVDVYLTDTVGRGTLVIRAQPIIISNGLAAAQAQRQNVQIASASGGVGLWALTSGEIQATLRSTTTFDAIYPATLCGPLPVASSTTVTPTTAPPAGTVTTLPTTAPASATVTTSTLGTVYVVQQGDTLGRIAARFGTTVSALAAANGITDPSRIFAGQSIVIPTGATTITVSPPGTTTTQPQPPASTGTVSTNCTSPYTVRAGDTLYRIATRCGFTVSQLAALNNIADPRRIYVGQVIRFQ